MERNKKIILYLTLALLGTAAIIVIISLNMRDKEYVQESKSSDGTHSEPTVIEVERDPEMDKRKAVRNSFASTITAQPDGFDANTFGGITNLKIKVRNETAYVLDNVELQVRYIKAGGGVFKTETVYVDNVGANTSKVVGAPESNRGTDVEVRIAAITSRAMGLCYVSGKKGPDAEDPYVCN